jgi:hypothetical protein
MLTALRFAGFGVVAVLCMSSAALAQAITPPDFTQGDAEKGKQVYQRAGLCATCHGWPADGQTGRNPMARGAAANLRETQLDQQGLYDVIRCGLPGTTMPYHDTVSYRDDRCHGLLFSDFDASTRPVKGKSLSERQMVDLVAYLEKYVVGLGKPTYEECALYFDTSADKSCASLKDK